MDYSQDRKLHPSSLIREAIGCIESNNAKIVFVVDESSRLVGTVTDGDIRRAILGGKNVDATVAEIMNSSPAVASLNDSRKKIQRLMKEKDHRYIPVVDSHYRIQRVEKISDYLMNDTKENLVFLMAGGFGKRLRPLTDDIPKPMLKVGNKPILECILENFIESGFSKFCITVHYKAEMIQKYFGDGTRWNVEIRYTQESKPLGTAGALSLLWEKPTNPVIVMNGDILTKVNFDNLLDFHIEHQSVATLCVREHHFQVPYGTVEVEGHQVIQLIEKPSYEFFINAGIYVLEPEVVVGLARNEYKDMPNLLNDLRQIERKVSVFPIHEYWLDMGGANEYEQAQLDYIHQFQ